MYGTAQCQDGGPKSQDYAENCGKSWKGRSSALVAVESLGKQLEIWDFAGNLGLYLERDAELSR